MSVEGDRRNEVNLLFLQNGFQYTYNLFSDVSLRSERVVAVERLCEVTVGILNSAEAAKLKQLILDSGVVSKVRSMDYANLFSIVFVLIASNFYGL